MGKTQRRWPWEDGGRDRAVVPLSQGTQVRRAGPRVSQRRRGPALPRLQVSGFQKGERINAWCFKPPQVWQFVMAAAGRDKRPQHQSPGQRGGGEGQLLRGGGLELLQRVRSRPGRKVRELAPPVKDTGTRK